MIDSIKSFFNSLGRVLAAIGAVLVGVLFIWLKVERNKNKELEGKLDTAEHDKKDAVLEQQGNDIHQQTAADVATLEEEKNKQLSHEEMAEFLKKQ